MHSQSQYRCMPRLGACSRTFQQPSNWPVKSNPRLLAFSARRQPQLLHLPLFRNAPLTGIFASGVHSHWQIHTTLRPASAPRCSTVRRPKHWPVKSINLGICNSSARFTRCSWRRGAAATHSRGNLEKARTGSAAAGRVTRRTFHLHLNMSQTAWASWRPSSIRRAHRCPC